MINYTFHGESRKGIRSENQDDYLVFKNKHGYLIAAVADGMGGHDGGRLASNLTITMIKKLLNNVNFANYTLYEVNEFLIEIIRKIQRSLMSEAMKHNLSLNMGTTINLNVFDGKKVFTLNIGDSRATQITRNKIHSISTDHNLAALAEKDKTYEKYKHFTNYLTSVLGPRKESKLDIFVTNLEKNGYIILTSDGIHNFISDEEMLKLSRKRLSVARKVSKIIDTAEANESTDNMTCILIHYEDR